MTIKPPIIAARRPTRPTIITEGIAGPNVSRNGCIHFLQARAVANCLMMLSQKKKRKKKVKKKLYEGIAVVKKAQITHAGDVRSCDSAPARIFSARKEKEKGKKESWDWIKCKFRVRARVLWGNNNNNNVLQEAA